MNKATRQMLERIQAAGITQDDALALRRCAMTLHRWYELECGDGNNYASWAIERDEKTDKPYMVRYPHQGATTRSPIPDREKGAHKRIATILQRYPSLTAYYQTDPRGAPLYILRPGDVPAGEKAESYYNRGIAVYK